MNRRHRWGRLGLAVGLVVGTAVVSAGAAPDPVAAATSISGSRTATGGSITVRRTESGPSRGPASTPPCRNAIVDPGELFPWPYEPPFEGGIYVRYSCYGEDLGWRWHANVPPELTYTETRTLELPRVHARIAPDPSGELVVGIPVHLWLDDPQWEIHDKGMLIDGTQVIIRAVPIAIEWDMGDGTIVTCAGPGVPFDPTRPAADQRDGCTYVYRVTSRDGARDGRFRVVARSVWRLSWWWSTAPLPTELGDVVLEQPFSVRVVEAQSILTPGRGGSR